MSTKVLIVLDSIYRFGNGAMPTGGQEFTFTTLVDALTAAGMQVTKAHRGSDSTADLQNFVFATANLLAFDVIWLIGFAGRNNPLNPPSGSSTLGGLGSTQLNAIAAFMEAGGGVFATGDHDSIGADMSGYLPRVLCFLAKRELFSIPFMGWYMGRRGHILPSNLDVRGKT